MGFKVALQLVQSYQPRRHHSHEGRFNCCRFQAPAWVDGQSVRTYCHAPNTGSCKSWTAGTRAMSTTCARCGRPTQGSDANTGVTANTTVCAHGISSDVCTFSGSVYFLNAYLHAGWSMSR
ncbi:hypothetical protein BGY98DRAFT_1052782 [Russula aff. rugulosa BPL654]|nr:hypothetical protein BGY98DRAFT_1052782 [Russula aff. rugulosa BPL654]